MTRINVVGWFMVIVVTGVTSCGPAIKHIPAMTVVSGLDFARYSARGFFLSMEPYTGPHDPIGPIVVTQYAEGNFLPVSKRDPYEPSNWTYKPVDSQEVLDSAYAVAVRLGANAIVKMQIRAVREGRPGVEVSGIAIKRK